MINYTVCKALRLSYINFNYVQESFLKSFVFHHQYLSKDLGGSLTNVILYTLCCARVKVKICKWSFKHIDTWEQKDCTKPLL